MNFTIFVSSPEESGHASGFGGFRGLSQAVDATIKANPLAVFDVIEVDAIGISHFDGLRSGEASMLALGQFAQLLSQFF